MQKLDKVVYTAHAIASGGRDGAAVTTDGKLKVKLEKQREMGGPADPKGVNPEQLFALGYSACFLSAVKHVANQQKLRVPENASVTGAVSIGTVPGGFGLAVELKVGLPGMDRKVAQALVEKAHTVCPYSNATRGNIDVKLTLVG